MNHIYRTVFNRTLGVWQVAAETAKRHGKGSGKAARSGARRVPGLSLIALLPLAASSAAWAALPAVGNVAMHAGAAAGAQAARPAAPSPSTLPSGGQVVAGSGAIAGSGNAMTIRQQSQNLAINWQSFNIGKDASVTFVQPNSQAIALNRVLGSDGTQILGQLKGNGQVWVLNPNGVLFGRSAQVSVGGLVASTLGLSDADFLAGKRTFAGEGGSVINQGNITAGYAALLGETVRNEGVIAARLGTAALAAGDQVTLDFNGDALLSVQVDEGALQAQADNRGLIAADGGTVLMTARAKDALLDTAVNNRGVIRARTLENRAGKILLLGDMASGTATIAGTLDASAPEGGDGGFIETSAAHVSIADSATITTKAANGHSGKWLIDPVDFTVAASGGDMTGAALSNALQNSDVEIQSTAGASGVNGDVNIKDTVSWNQHILTLNAQRDINIASRLNASGAAGLFLKFNQADAGGTYNIDAPVNLASTGSFRTQAGSAGAVTNWTIITSLGAEGSSTGTDLQGISGNLSGHYVLGADIDASSTALWNGGTGFTPIGDSTNAFSGSLDGLGHVIDGLSIQRLASDNIGLFGYSNAAQLSHVGLSNVDIQGNDNVGALLGLGTGLNRIDHAWSSGKLYSDSRVFTRGNVGGLVGRLNGILSYSHSSATVEANANVGGLVGRLGYNMVRDIPDRITHSYATGDVRADRGAGGGLVGQSEGRIDHSYATGNVSGGRSLGGLIGQAGYSFYWGGLYGYGRLALININYATGNVTGNQGSFGVGVLYGNDIGGLIGRIMGGNFIIANSFATGNVSGYDAVGGLIGYVEPNSAQYKAPAVFSTYTLGGTVTGHNNVGGLVGQVDGFFDVWETYVASGLLTATATDQPQRVGALVGYSMNLSDDIAINTAVWNRETTGTDHMSGQDFMGPIYHGPGYITGEDYLSSRRAIGATTAQMKTLEPYYLSGFYGGNWNQHDYTILTDSTATGRDFVEDDPYYGLLFNTFRMYEGKTYPLLMAFLTTLEVGATPDYDGSGAALGNIASSSLSTVPSGAHIFGTGTVVPGDTLTLTSTQDGSYTATTNGYVVGLYSDSQFGYNIRGGVNSRVISTPGSVAGEIRLPDAITWNYGNLVIDNNGAITTAGAGGANRTAINGHQLRFTNGSWMQNAGTLPEFTLTGNFELSNATFLRAAGGSGTVADPWRLTDVYGLQGMASAAYLGNSFALMNDIDGSLSRFWNGGAGFIPVGNGSAAFTGHFDGGGHDINGLTILRDQTDDVGLFGHVTGGSLSHVRLSQISVKGHDNVGILAGHIDGGATVSDVHVDGMVIAMNTAGALVGNSDGQISDSHASGSVDTYKNKAGGLVGQNGANGRISGSSSTAGVYGAAYIGGLVGSSDGVVDNSHASGSVAAAKNIYGGTSAPDEAAYAGGLVGYVGTGGQIVYSYATGNVAALNGSKVGGLVGEAHAGITGSFATGKVTGYGYVGGLVGATSGDILNSYATGTVQNGVFESDLAVNSGPNWVGGLAGWSGANITQSYATGAVTPVGWNSGGLVGEHTGGSIVSSFYATTDALGAGINNSGNGQISISDPWRGNIYGSSKTLAELQQASTFAGWDMAGTSSVWRIYQGHTSPLLRHFMTAVTVSAAPSSGKTYDGRIASGTISDYDASVPVDSSLLAGSLSYATTGADAGTYSTADGSLQISGELYSSQLGYDISYASTSSLTIAKANATVTAHGDTVGYDGQGHGVAGYTVSGLVNGEDASVISGLVESGGSGRDAGSYAHAVSGGTAANYALSYVDGSLTIDKALLSIGTSDASKVYDGSTHANGNAVVVGGQLFGADALSGGNFSYADKHAGTGKTVTVDGVTVSDGNGGNNYAITYVANTNSRIDKAGLTLGTADVRKTYDGSTAAAGTATVVGGSLFGGDTISGGSFAYTDQNAGSGKTVTVDGVTVNDGNGGNNYAVSYADNTSSRIDKAAATVTANSGRVSYDGQGHGVAGYTISGLVNGEDDSVISGLTESGGSGRDAGSYAHAVSGGTAANYELNHVDGSLVIDKALLSIGTGDVSKVYDGSTHANGSAVVVGGQLFGGDAIAGGEFAYDDKNAGTGKTVTVDGVTVDDGNGGGNYAITYVANTGSRIDKAGVSVGGSFAAADKAADGRVDAGITRNELTLDGVVGGDAVAVDWRAVFADAQVGSDKPVTLDGTALTGSDRANYALDLTGAPTTLADILQAAPTPTPTPTPTPMPTSPLMLAFYAGATGSAHVAGESVHDMPTAKHERETGLPGLVITQCGQRLPTYLTEDCR